MKEKEEFGKFIVQKRKEANLTQRELAEKLYVTESAVSKWERGRSYPDIAAVTPLCKILNITEHELITASDDKHQRELEKQASTMLRYKDRYLRILCFLFTIMLATCLICNIAINHTVSWFFIVLGGVTVAFSLMVVPVWTKRNKGLWTLGSFCLSLFFLLIVIRTIFKGEWFLTTLVSLVFAIAVVFLPFVFRRIELPELLSEHKTLLCFVLDSVILIVLVTVATFQYGNSSGLLKNAYLILFICLLYPWLLMLVIRYCQVNAFFKTAICFFITGSFIFVINNSITAILTHTPFKMLEVDFLNWKDDKIINGNITFITAFICITICIVFAVYGAVSVIKKKQNK